MDDTEGPIAIFRPFRNDAEGHYVGKLFKADVPFLHLFPNGIGMLLASGNRYLQAPFAQQQLQVHGNAGDLVAAAFLQMIQPFGDAVAGVGLKLLKGKELHFAHELRSEEHTSELQSLMRISYAVFCLKKKIQTTNRKRS